MINFTKIYKFKIEQIINNQLPIKSLGMVTNGHIISKPIIEAFKKFSFANPLFPSPINSALMCSYGLLSAGSSGEDVIYTTLTPRLLNSLHTGSKVVQ